MQRRREGECVGNQGPQGTAVAAEEQEVEEKKKNKNRTITNAKLRCLSQSCNINHGNNRHADRENARSTKFWQGKLFGKR